MDTISRENNNSLLPVGAVILGVIALLLSGYAVIKLSKIDKALSEQDAKLARIESVESAATSATSAAEKASRDLNSLVRQTQDAFTQVGDALGTMRASITKLEDSAKKPAPAPVAAKKEGGATPPAAAPGEYVVKTGDVSGAKIARDHGIPLGDLMAVNPGVNWNALKVGQKLKLPTKR